ncbi:unnamed protein product, partial [Ectocarpus sp. 12 AP-2014]
EEEERPALQRAVPTSSAAAIFAAYPLPMGLAAGVPGHNSTVAREAASMASKFAAEPDGGDRAALA